MRPAFLAAAARPFLRRRSTACSMSPSASVSAALQFIIGAPVRSRSCLTICAVTSMLTLLCSYHADKRKGQIDAGSTDLFATRPAARRRPAPDMVPVAGQAGAALLAPLAPPAPPAPLGGAASLSNTAKGERPPGPPAPPSFCRAIA